jgi:mono/diheme cytochrome c family protein
VGDEVTGPVLALTLRTGLIALNLAAVAVIAVVLVTRVLSLRASRGERLPANVEAPPGDETLEGSGLTAVLRWTLLFSAILAVALPLYWLLEPYRQSDAELAFDERAVKRGEVLYANDQMEAFDAAKSLGCANCHGTDGGGGSASFVLTGTAQGDPEARPVQVVWKAPAVNDIFYRFDEEQVNQILTYGRPGTPMPAWGLAGGGPKNEQGITDLIAYLRSIQVSPAKARAAVRRAAQDLRDQAADAPARAAENLARAERALAEATTPQARARAQDDLEAARVAVQRSRAFAAEIGDAGEGQVLFETNCARCHTRGWSYSDPTNGRLPPPYPPGSGGFGPSLRDGSTLVQFPGRAGRERMYEWIAVGAPVNRPYGVQGVSSGAMPHFGRILTKAQIDAIIDYERRL